MNFTHKLSQLNQRNADSIRINKYSCITAANLEKPKIGTLALKMGETACICCKFFIYIWRIWFLTILTSLIGSNANFLFYGTPRNISFESVIML